MSGIGATMKANIHPEYKEITVTCSCGHTFVTGSALGKDLHIEVCNECHPFYTGKQKIVDTAGRVERFKSKFGSTSLKGKQAAEGEDESKTEVAEKPKAAPKQEVKPQAQKAKTDKAPQQKAGKNDSAKSSKTEKKSK